MIQIVTTFWSMAGFSHPQRERERRGVQVGVSVEGQGHDQEDAAEDTEGEAETNMSTIGIAIPSIGQETGCKTMSHQSQHHSDFEVHRLIAK